MNIRIAFRGMDHSASIEEYVHKRLGKVLHFLQREPTPLNIDVVLDAARQHHHHDVEVRLHSKHYKLMAHHEGPELYVAIDCAVDTLVKEIKKAHDKMVTERNHPYNLPEPLEEKEEFEGTEV